MIGVFIGYDRHETVAFHVLAHSIMRRASVPVSITGLVLNQLDMKRERHPLQSTEFSFSRFLVPHMSGFGALFDYSVFMDCDMLCRGDIAELMTLAKANDEPVSVVKHDYTPSTQTKFLNQPQSCYEKKNWSSVMVFRNADCKMLTRDYVDTATGLELHQFQWADEVGGLPVEWNHLVGEYPPNPQAKLAHFTIGTPCFEDYRECEFSDEWYAERSLMVAYERKSA